MKVKPSWLDASEKSGESKSRTAHRHMRSKNSFNGCWPAKIQAIPITPLPSTKRAMGLAGPFVFLSPKTLARGSSRNLFSPSRLLRKSKPERENDNMKTMKFLVIALIGLFANMSFGAGLEVLLSGGTNNVSAFTTNSYANKTFTPVDAATAAIQVSFTSSSATNLGNIVLWFDTSADNSSWSTNAVSLTVSTNGAAVPLTVVSNITVGAIPFYRLGRVANQQPGANGYITNLTVKAFTKRNGI